MKLLRSLIRYFWLWSWMKMIGISATSFSYSCTGSGYASLSIPSNVNALYVNLYGAAGGNITSATYSGGYGAHLTGTVSVTPGSTVYIYVGCQPAPIAMGTPSPSGYNSGGYNGGGKGFTVSSWCTGSGAGGATDIRTTLGDASTRIAVAGGGGGVTSACSSRGGDTGTNGNVGCSNGFGNVGGGATPTSPGSSGGCYAVFCATAGSGEIGGDGGGLCGGGGGGGYFGGGGGAAFDGGGGGSSKATGSSYTVFTGVSAGNGTADVMYVYYPTSQPSTQPTSNPSNPSSQPSSRPSDQPSRRPTNQPTRQPTSQPSRQPIRQPTSQPTVHPTVQPSARPSRQPSMQPSGQPTRRPSSKPTSQPSRQPSSVPSVQPSTRPSQQPSVHPSSQPSRQPSSHPSKQPWRAPSTQPSCRPTNQPSKAPSSQPSAKPSRQPSGQPSAQPSRQPTMQPTCQPSAKPSDQPSCRPSEQPSDQPTGQPSIQPSVQPSLQPSARPSGQPTSRPSAQPSTEPSEQPSIHPSRQPSVQPSAQPSTQPSVGPTAQPSLQPSGQPSDQPTSEPSAQPSTLPTIQPSTQPTVRPSMQPTCLPSDQPSEMPTGQPTVHPSTQPSSRPTVQPSSRPTCAPTRQPSTQPSMQPTCRPSHCPTSQPSAQPSVQPIMHPTSQPSMSPTDQPSRQPSNRPTMQPTCSPSSHPTRQPSGKPSYQPSLQPSARPSAMPTAQPSVFPTLQPASKPSSVPTSVPSGNPTFSPTTYHYLLTHPRGTLPFNKSISVEGNGGFKIVLPYGLIKPVLSKSAFCDVVVGSGHVGNIYLVKGKTRMFDGIDLISGGSAETVTTGLATDLFGRSAAVVGDFNGDSYNDFIIGDPFHSKCYVVFGSELGMKNMTEGFTIFGEDDTDLAGWSVSGAGDVNNDSYADIIVGAPNAHGVGAVYVIYGHKAVWDVQLGDFAKEKGFAIYGMLPGDLFGVSVSNAGDFNKDGYDDIIVGSIRSASLNSGSGYVIFGGLEVSTEVPVMHLIKLRGGVIAEGLAFSQAGYSVAGAGDVNSDGFDDVLIGSYPVRPSLQSMTYLLYGCNCTQLNQTSLKLSSLADNEGIQLNGGGFIVNQINDINHDGYDDLMIVSNGGSTITSGLVVYLPPGYSSYKPTVKPTAMPSMRPSGQPFVPFMDREMPTSTPSTTAPTSKPSTEQPTLMPSTEPSLSAPSSHPSVNLTHIPTRRYLPKTVSPTMRPWSLPTVVPTVGNAFDYVYVGDEGLKGNSTVNRKNRDTVFTLNATNAVVKLSGGCDRFLVVPYMKTTVTIDQFNLSCDVIDLTLFSPYIESIKDLEIKSKGHLEMSLIKGQTIRLLNVASHFMLENRNFDFGNSTDATRENKTFETIYLIISISGGSALCLAVVVFCGQKLWEAAEEARELEEAEQTVDRIVLKRNNVKGSGVKRDRKESKIIILQYIITLRRMSRWNTRKISLPALMQSNKNQVLEKTLEEGNEDDSSSDSASSSIISFNPIVDVLNEIEREWMESEASSENLHECMDTPMDSKSDQRYSISSISYDPLGDLANEKQLKPDGSDVVDSEHTLGSVLDLLYVSQSDKSPDVSV